MGVGGGILCPASIRSKALLRHQWVSLAWGTEVAWPGEKESLVNLGIELPFCSDTPDSSSYLLSIHLHAVLLNWESGGCCGVPSSATNECVT